MCTCHFCFTGLGFKHLLLLTVRMTLLKLLLCLDKFLFASSQLCQISFKMLAMWRNSTSAFFGWCVLWTKDLGQRHLKARRRKKAGYAEPAFAIWENYLKTAVLCSFLTKEHCKQAGYRMGRKAAKNCIVLVLLSINATWSCWSWVRVFISKEVQTIWQTCVIVYGSKVFL